MVDLEGEPAIVRNFLSRKMKVLRELQRKKKSRNEKMKVKLGGSMKEKWNLE